MNATWPALGPCQLRFDVSHECDEHIAERLIGHLPIRVCMEVNEKGRVSWYTIDTRTFLSRSHRHIRSALGDVFRHLSYESFSVVGYGDATSIMLLATAAQADKRVNEIIILDEQFCKEDAWNLNNRLPRNEPIVYITDFVSSDSLRLRDVLERLYVAAPRVTDVITLFKCCTVTVDKFVAEGRYIHLRYLMAIRKSLVYDEETNYS